MTLLKVNQHPVQRGFSNLFEDFINEFPAFGNRDAFTSVPVNINETADAYHLEFNAPGRSKEDFKINVEGGLLTVSFEKKEESKSEDYKTVRKEFAYSSFKRSFTIDDKINANAIQAKYENGLLKLLLPKKDQVKEKAKQISVD